MVCSPATAFRCPRPSGERKIFSGVIATVAMCNLRMRALRNASGGTCCSRILGDAVFWFPSIVIALCRVQQYRACAEPRCQSRLGLTIGSRLLVPQ
jgi:hypothetical protein